MSLWEREALRELLPHERESVKIVLLDTLPNAEELQALETRLKISLESVTLIGWKVPERNLDFPAHWASQLTFFFRGGENLDRYRLFLSSHGIEGVAFRVQRRVQFRRVLLWGAALLLRLTSLSA